MIRYLWPELKRHAVYRWPYWLVHYSLAHALSLLAFVMFGTSAAWVAAILAVAFYAHREVGDWLRHSEHPDRTYRTIWRIDSGVGVAGPLLNLLVVVVLA